MSGASPEPLGSDVAAYRVAAMLLLGTAVVCIAPQIVQLDRCQPRVRSTSQRELA